MPVASRRRYMRITASVLAFIGFQFLIACGGEVERSPSAAPPLEVAPAPAVSPESPSVAVPPAPIVAEAAPRTDLHGADPEAEAICAENAKRAPAGTYTADPVLEIAGALDVAAVPRGNDGTELQLFFQFPSVIGDGPSPGQRIRADWYHTMSLWVDARPGDAFAVGTTTGHFVNERLWDWQCSNLPIGFGGAFSTDGSDTANVVITSRTATMLEASLEITSRVDGSVSHLAFRAPIVNVNPFVESRVCCLAQR